MKGRPVRDSVRPSHFASATVEHTAEVEADRRSKRLSVVGTDWIRVSGRKTMCWTGCASRLLLSNIDLSISCVAVGATASGFN